MRELLMKPHDRSGHGAFGGDPGGAMNVDGLAWLTFPRTTTCGGLCSERMASITVAESHKRLNP